MNKAQLISKFVVSMAMAWTLCGFQLARAQPVTNDAIPPTAAAGVPNAKGLDYKLGPGDKLRVIVFNEPTLSGEFFVSNGGKISFPLVGEVNAVGVSLEAFREDLQGKLSAGYLKDPRISVEVLTYRPFYILGEVMKPGEYPYSSGLSIMKAVATAGGFTYRAQTGRVFVRHLDQSKEQLVPLSADIAVQPGDTIRVSERFF